ncbi:MAG: acyl-CoA thioesterase [Candidatus Thorarchaeota archaeon]|nr:acyl-CoA thioesterase [Candidatus Thorarchaeota archaeon]MCK5238527.1 acyl-CoA thioesterase [Candidatus Thorarchaeota archaeon]
MSKTVSESRTLMTQTVFPNDVNNNGTLYGGRLLDWIDTIAGIVAKRHCRTDVVTASIDSLNFLNPIFQRDIVNLEAWINYVGRTSMEIEVRVTSEDPITAEIRKTCRAFLTYVAVDSKSNPIKVPRLECSNKEEIGRAELAKKRRVERLRLLELEPTEW